MRGWRGWVGCGRGTFSRGSCVLRRERSSNVYRARLCWSAIAVSWRRVFLRVRGQVSAPRTEKREDEVFVALAICAVRAEGLIPGFPSQAFVKHCSCPQRVSGSSSCAPPRGSADLRVAPPHNRSAEKKHGAQFLLEWSSQVGRANCRGNAIRFHRSDSSRGTRFLGVVFALKRQGWFPH